MASSAMLIFLVAVSATWQMTIGATNLLQNPSFEDGFTGWSTSGYKNSLHTADKVHGNYSLMVKDRKNGNSGPVQENITLVKGRHYEFVGYVKLLNDVEGTIWQYLKATIDITLNDGKTQGYNIAFRSFCNTSNGWIKLKGDIEAPMKDFSSTRLMIRGLEQEVNYLLDSCSLHEMPEDAEWRKKADKNIEKHRKSNVIINVELPTGVPASNVSVEVSLKKHKFAFGSMVRYEDVLEVPVPKVMKIFYSLFQWATIQNYKWKFMKDDPLNSPNMSRAIDSTKILRKNGLSVRAHSIFWNVEKNIPTEVLKVSAEDTPRELKEHLEYTMTQAKDLAAQWDVQNEHIAEHYYEEKTQWQNISKLAFKWAKNMNDSGVLYLNEFQCVTSGAQTEQLYDLAKEYLDEGIPLQGLGIQGHTKWSVKPDPTSMWRRLDRLGQLKIPIMMTEFDLGWENRLERADWFEDSIRAFFGHPALVGVVIWDYWNETMRYPHKELIRGKGDDFEILESGQRWACLVNKEWRTQKTYQPTASSSSFSLRGFQGDYEVLVKRNGQYVQKKDFSLGKDSATWDLDVTSSTDTITVKTKDDFVKECISHREQKSVGKSSKSSTGAGLSCKVVKSGYSEGSVNANVSVSCPTGYVMTACMSYQRDKKWYRNGEKIEVESNTAKCYAFNGHEGRGVKAWAICCNGSGLQCDYQTAGPSFPMDGAMAEATCASGELALGCSSYSYWPVSDGVRPKDDAKACRAQSGDPLSTDPNKKSGDYVYSACCKADSALTCSLKTGDSSASTSKVSCPSGTVMTGCNAFADDGYAAGARVKNQKVCVANLGKTLPAGSAGVRAYATCCSV